jgi:hypothetical protein
MNKRQTELARQLIAWKHWRWMPGMRWILTFPAPFDPMSGRVSDPAVGVWRSSSSIAAAAYPDLDDPATIGCLLALVREAWGDSGMSPMAVLESVPGTVAASRVKRWEICGLEDLGKRWLPHWFSGWFPTEAEALAAALLGAP